MESLAPILAVFCGPWGCDGWVCGGGLCLTVEVGGATCGSGGVGN